MNLWGVFPWGQPPLLQRPFRLRKREPQQFFYDQHGGAAHGPPLRPPMNFDRLVLDSTSLCVPGACRDPMTPSVASGSGGSVDDVGTRRSAPAVYGDSSDTPAATAVDVYDVAMEDVPLPSLVMSDETAGADDLPLRRPRSDPIWSRKPGTSLP